MVKKLFIFVIIIVLIIFSGFIYFNLQKIAVFRMPTGSMEPTIKMGEKFSVDRFAFNNKIPQRGEIVTFKDPKDEKKVLVKRVIGLPGETVQIANGKIVIDDREIKSDIYYYNAGEFGKENKQITVPADSFYVLGDNSKANRDSRYWGFVPRKNIQGKVILIKSKENKIRGL